MLHLLLLAILVKVAVLGSMLLPTAPPAPRASSDAPGQASAEAPAESGVRLVISRELITPAFAQQQPPAAPAAEQAGEAYAGLREKREELERRELALKTLEQEVDVKLAKLQETQAKLEQMLTEAKETRDAKLRHLIDVYTNMKAKQAAAVIETLNEEIAVKILAGMRGKQAGEILTNVQAEKAAKLSERLTRMQVPF